MNALKGIVSTYDENTKKARVTFTQFDDGVTAELPVMFTPMIGFLVSGDMTASIDDPTRRVEGQFTLGGDIQIEYKPDIKTGDIVIVIFFSSGFQNGVVIGKVEK